MCILKLVIYQSEFNVFEVMEKTMTRPNHVICSCYIKSSSDWFGEIMQQGVSISTSVFMKEKQEFSFPKQGTRVSQNRYLVPSDV